MKNVMLISGLAVVLLTTACNKDRIRLKGEGPVVSEERSVSSFDEVKLSMDADVIWHADSNYHCVVEAQKNIAKFILTEQRGDEIRVKLKRFTTIRKYKPIKIHLYGPRFERAEVTGSGDVIVDKGVKSTSVTLRVSGSGDVELNNPVPNEVNASISGSGEVRLASPALCQRSEYSISGSGKISALSTPTNEVDVRVTGSGSLYVYVQKQLDARISGSGKVRYKGSPQIQTKITGSGSVREY